MNSCYIDICVVEERAPGRGQDVLHLTDSHVLPEKSNGESLCVPRVLSPELLHYPPPDAPLDAALSLRILVTPVEAQCFRHTYKQGCSYFSTDEINEDINKEGRDLSSCQDR